MEIKLRDYQNEAIKKIYNFFLSNDNKGKMYIPTGSGKTIIIAFLVNKILQNNSDNSILVLTSKRIVCDQIKSVFDKHMPDINTSSINVATYQDFANYSSSGNFCSFSLIICDDAQFIDDEKFGSIFNCKDAKYLGILQNNVLPEGWFGDARCVFKYTIAEAIKVGYIDGYREGFIVEHFFKLLLDKSGFENIRSDVTIESIDNKMIRPDIIAEKDSKHFMFEIKVYHSLHNQFSILDNAIKQVFYYKSVIERVEKDKNFSFVAIMLCEVDKQLKQNMFELHNIIIWDIANLVYFCSDDKELSELLKKCTPYSIAKIKGEQSINLAANAVKHSADMNEGYLEKFQKRLERCKPGKSDKSDKEYESICTDIVKYLFEAEFSQISEQHTTNDDMFRMDLLCSLKGSTEFWKFLIHFYGTKFVVFEYKNYSKKISQNLIYTTGKYLFPAVLRNVAFIVSRAGFDDNAEKAAIGYIKEEKKLIISLTDEDLVLMIAKKDKGEEPSDYLLSKIEKLLMSVSK